MSKLALFGADAFPVSLNGNGDVAIAATRTEGGGRIVVAGKQQAFFGTNQDTAPFVANAVSWLAGGADSLTIGSYDKKIPSGFPDTPTKVPTSDLASGKEEFQMFCSPCSCREIS